ncbi:MAG: hypothetical protein RIQ93_2381, partial [Verrucomicrobiota bacterium]|jgi:hypothetical protein
VNHARAEAVRGFDASANQAANVIAAAKVAALSEMDTRFAEAGAALVAHVTRELRKLELAATTAAIPAKPISAEPTSTVAEPVPEANIARAEAAPESGLTGEEVETPARRSRKPRREEANTAATPLESPPAPVSDSVPAPAYQAAGILEPAPVPLGQIPEINPLAAHDAPTFKPTEPEPTAPVVESNPPPADTPPALEAEPKPIRKRAKKAEVELSANLDLGIEDTPAPAERVLTSDGATRLIVTAYIGIGNRLFIRGAGAGLSWEKGAPLQFISIGKWRWESNEATSAVEFRLYKNDEQECAAVGLQSVEPGYQQEITATF